MKTTLTPAIVSEQIIAFVDLVGYHSRICARLAPQEAFEFLAEYYSVVQRASEGSNARIVKFIGDSILILFPAESASDALASLREVKTAVDGWLDQGRFDSRLRIKAHVGEVAAGSLGGCAFDVCGIAVNETALLPDGDWVVSGILRERTNA
jgi:class 3 adenylate cyclase